MAAIFPIPSGRTSDLLLQSRLLAQLQSNQLDLLRLQVQLSTGLRISAPSEDAPAARRAMDLQRILEQKQQVKSNLATSQSYLAASDSAISGVSQLLAQVRGTALSVSDDTSSATSRQAAIQEIRHTLEQLIDIGNHEFRGRYLFAGSRTTVLPFEMDGQFVVYRGNEGGLSSYADVDLLQATSVPGTKVFGAISAGVSGSVDLNPILTADTRLADLNGGQGIRKGSFVVSDGSTSRTIDISRAETIGDVVRLIENNPPAGRKVTARIGSGGLTIDIDDALGGNLTIKEVGGGTTAAELGILQAVGTGTSPIVGADLNPLLRLTTRLSDVLGARASAVVTSAGANNDILLEARTRGAENNGVVIQYVNDALLQAAPGLVAGNETVTYTDVPLAARAALTFSGTGNNLVLTANTPGVGLNNVQINVVNAGAIGNAAQVNYDSVGKVLTIGIDSADGTEVQTLINAINANGTFTAAYDASAAADGGFSATAPIPTADAGVVSGNTGNSGAAANTILVNVEAGKSTANQVVAALQTDPIVSALFDARIDTKDTSTASNAGKGAVDLTAQGVTSGGSGEEFDKGSGLRIVNAGSTYTVSFQDATTVEDLLNILNGSKAGVLAQINAQGTGIDIRSRLSGADFQIGENGGTTATQLGVRSLNLDTALTDLNQGLGVETAEGTDFVIRRNDGVELNVDISSAKTIGDILNLINNHPDNLDPASRVVAKLKDVGNGIELVDDDPIGSGTLTIVRAFESTAVWDLGLVPRGSDEISSSDGPSASAATATVAFSPPDDQNNRFTVTAAQVGTALNGVQVEFVNSAASGDQAFVSFDPIAKKLTIDVDPAATTANTVIDAINTDDTFSAALDLTTEPTNDGSGLITQTGAVAVLAGGSPNPTALSAGALVTFAPPNDQNTALLVTANQAGTSLNGVTVEFEDTLVGNVANAVFDSINGRLVVSIDATQTTAATIATAIANEGTFFAQLDTSTDPTNDGSGVVGAVGVVATTQGGTAEVIGGTDVNPLEVHSTFNSLLRLMDALDGFDLVEIERAIALIDEDLDRVNFTRAELGAAARGLDTLQIRLEDENVELNQALSNEIDVDLVDAISRLTTQQAAFQASLQMIGQTFQLTLLDFL